MSENLPITQAEFDFSKIASDLVLSTPDGYSNTIELFDSLLRFSTKRIRSVANREERTVEFRRQKYRVGISPAIIKGSKGETLIIMPGEREDLVEKALRKIAAESIDSLKITKEDVGPIEIQVCFTIYQIRTLLADTGHDFKSCEIEQALEVLQAARIDIETEQGALVGGVRSGIFQTYIYSKKRKGDAAGKQSRGWVKFHPLVTKSIIDKTNRRIEWKRFMGLKIDLARWLFQRMSHNYTQAENSDWYTSGKGYHISLETIMNESGMDRSGRLRDNVRWVRRALDELKTEKADVLYDYEETLKYADANRPGPREVIGAVWLLKPTIRHVDEVIEQNKAKRKEQAVSGHLKPETRKLLSP